MLRSIAMGIYRDRGFDRLPLDRWRADAGMLDSGEVSVLRQRERAFVLWRTLRTIFFLPATTLRMLANFLFFVADLDRLHGAPRRKLLLSRGCVVDRSTWLANGSNIILGDFVKVSAFSALLAGVDAQIRIGHYSILGPGVMVVAANHGTAATGVPIRYQPWSEKEVVIGDDVWVGANAVILPGSSIGAGSIIGAGTIVSGDIPAGSIVHRDKSGSVVFRQRK